MSENKRTGKLSHKGLAQTLPAFNSVPIRKTSKDSSAGAYFCYLWIL